MKKTNGRRDSSNKKPRGKTAKVLTSSANGSPEPIAIDLQQKDFINVDNTLLMQRLVGNKTVTRQIQAKQSSQYLPKSITETKSNTRQGLVNDDSFLPINRWDDEENVPDEEEHDPLLEELIGLSNSMNNTLELPARWYIEAFEAVRSPLSVALAGISTNFESAWGKHNRVLQDAQLEAQNENVIREIIVGAAASLFIAVAAEAIIPAAFIEGGLASGGWWTVQTGSAAGSGFLGTRISNALAAPTNFDSILPSNLGELRQLHGLLRFERRLNTIYRAAFNISGRLRHLDTIIQEIQAGNRDIVLDEAAEFIQRKDEIMGFFGSYVTGFQSVQALQERIDSFTVPGKTEIEQAIWIHWIASLSASDHDLLDSDELEDYLHGPIGVLGHGSILGVDTRLLFDTKLELMAILRAHSHKQDVLEQLAGPF